MYKDASNLLILLGWLLRAQAFAMVPLSGRSNLAGQSL
jgi:hypothetical protein